MPSSHASKYPDHILQAVLVPKARVRGSVARARVIAERYGAKPGDDVDETKNFFEFRREESSLMRPGSYISFKSPGDVVVRKAILSRGARENPSDSGNGIWYAIGAAAVVFIGAGILTARSAHAAIAPNPNNPVPVTPPRTVARPTRPTPTPARQVDGFDPNATSTTRTMQLQLKALGYGITSVDGVFGPNTEAAVTAFVNANGLSFATTQGRDIISAIDVQYAYFFDERGGIRSI